MSFQRLSKLPINGREVRLKKIFIYKKLLAVADPGFSPGGAPTPKIAIIFHILPKTA